MRRGVMCWEVAALSRRHSPRGHNLSTYVSESPTGFGRSEMGSKLVSDTVPVRWQLQDELCVLLGFACFSVVFFACKVVAGSVAAGGAIMGSRSRMLALNSRSASQNGRLSPYGQVRGSSMGGGGAQSMGGGGGPLPAAILEQKIQSQHMEIQSLLTENQRLAATQVALRQELAAAQQEMQRMTSMVAGIAHKQQCLSF